MVHLDRGKAVRSKITGAGKEPFIIKAYEFVMRNYPLLGRPASAVTLLRSNASEPAQLAHRELGLTESLRNLGDGREFLNLPIADEQFERGFDLLKSIQPELHGVHSECSRT